MTVSPITDLLQEAVTLHRRGAIDEAVARYDAVLRADPANADAYYYLALIACQSGRFADGAELAGKALLGDPRHARAHVLLGRAWSALGRQDEALTSFDRAIAIAPDLAEAHGNRGDVLSELGRHADAVDSYDRSLTLSPGSFQDWFNRGLELATLGRADDAVSSLDRAIASKPDYAQAHMWRAKVLSGLRQYGDALQSVDKALAIAPALAEAWFGRGNILSELGRNAEAIESYDRALALVPNSSDGWFNRGMTLIAVGRQHDAISSFDRAIACNGNSSQPYLWRAKTLLELRLYTEALEGIDKILIREPNLAEAWLGRAIILFESERYEEAVVDCGRALALRPNFAEAYVCRGNIAQALGQHTEALVAHDKAIALNPDVAEAWHGRGIAFFEMNRLTEALAAYDKALLLKPDFSSAISNRIFALDFVTGSGFEEQQTARSAWWQTIGSALAKQSKIHHTNARDVSRIIKLGYVSADFRTHSAAFAFMPILRNHDKSKFEITCYSSSRIDDETTNHFRQSANRWRDVTQVSDDALCEHIQADQIDILVDLSGHSQGNRLGVFARKPAPIQVTAWGHAAGTGLPTIDYMFSDPVACPPEVRHLFAEKIFDLPCLISIDPLPGWVRPAILPLLSKGRITFGVFNRSSKISDEAIELWAQILHSLPDSEILLKHGGFDAESTRSRFLEKFSMHGIPGHRIVFLGASPREDHLAAFGKVDISLDPFPMGGGISTWESLQMGVPVIAKLGNGIGSRVAGAILSAVGMADWVADTADGYLAIAQKFAGVPEHLKALRAGLPARLAESTAGNSVKYTRAVEAAYRKMWAEYCRCAPA
jgi:predicted O-linked N-acetylglucosamine transferase (SPINDLY family)